MEALRLLVLRENVDQIRISEISKEDLRELPPVALVSNFRKCTG
jgi:hypothetical protein